MIHPHASEEAIIFCKLTNPQGENIPIKILKMLLILREYLLDTAGRQLILTLENVAVAS